MTEEVEGLHATLIPSLEVPEHVCQNTKLGTERFTPSHGERERAQPARASECGGASKKGIDSSRKRDWRLAACLAFCILRSQLPEGHVQAFWEIETSLRNADAMGMSTNTTGNMAIDVNCGRPSEYYRALLVSITSRNTNSKHKKKCR